MRCIYTEKVCRWEVVGPMGGEWLKEAVKSSVRDEGEKGIDVLLRWNYSAEAWLAGRSLPRVSGRLLFFSLCSSCFQDLLRLKSPTLLMLLGCISVSMASLTRRSM